MFQILFHLLFQLFGKNTKQKTPFFSTKDDSQTPNRWSPALINIASPFSSFRAIKITYFLLRKTLMFRQSIWVPIHTNRIQQTFLIPHSKYKLSSGTKQIQDSYQRGWLILK